MADALRIEWEEPPNNRGGGKGRGAHEDLFDELRLHPGRWAVFARNVSSSGGYTDRLKNGMYSGISAGEVEVASHRVTSKDEPRRYDIYVRIPKTNEESE